MTKFIDRDNHEPLNRGLSAGIADAIRLNHAYAKELDRAGAGGGDRAEEYLVQLLGLVTSVLDFAGLISWEDLKLVVGNGPMKPVEDENVS